MNERAQLELAPLSRSFHAALPELLRPVFFPGQLLTSEDLTALETWVRQRLVLSRRDNGWGVVCGLEIVAENEIDLILDPGHAIDPAGRDIVVGQRVRVSLKHLCSPAGCLDGAEAGCVEPPSKEKKRLQIGGFSISNENLRIVDVVLHYHEEERDFRPILQASSQGARHRDCKPARAMETFELKLQPAGWEEAASQPRDTPSQQDAAVERMLTDFETSLNELWNWKPGPSNAGWEKKRKEVVEWFEKYRKEAGSYPFLFDLLKPDFQPWHVAEMLFWLVLSAQSRSEACGPCPDGKAGVPLARVWMEAGGGACRILWVDRTGQAKRGLASALIAKDGGLDLARFHGRSWSAARSTLLAFGLSAEVESVRLPAVPGEVRDLLRCNHRVSNAQPGQKNLVALVSSIPDSQDSVLGFYSADKSAPDFHAEISKVWLVPSDKTTADASLSLSSVASEPASFLSKDSIPVGGLIKVAFAVTSFKIPASSKLQLHLFNGLVNEVIPYKEVESDPGTLYLQTNTFEIPIQRRESQHFGLLVGTDNRHTSSQLPVPWSVQQQSLQVELNRPLVVVDVKADGTRSISYSLQASNKSPNAVTAKYSIDGGLQHTMDLPANTDGPPITEPPVATDLTKTIALVEALDEFRRPAEILPSSIITFSWSSASIQFNVTKKTGNIFNLEMTIGTGSWVHLDETITVRIDGGTSMAVERAVKGSKLEATTTFAFDAAKQGPFKCLIDAKYSIGTVEVHHKIEVDVPA